MIVSPLNEIESIRLLESKDFLERLISEISKARHKIHLQMYIFEVDNVGIKVLKSLKEKAKQGVLVYLLIDPFGSPTFTKALIEELSLSGINVDYFKPPLAFSQNLGFGLGHRLHRKVIVIDQETLIIGGINIGEKFFLTKDNPDWLDFAIETNSKIAKVADLICENTWIRRKALKIQKIDTLLPNIQSPIMKLSENYWYLNHHQIYKSYLTKINKSKTHIFIIAAYFFPGKRILKSLIKASKRGVKVEIIFGQFLDVYFLKYATQYLYKKLLKNGVLIYEYPHSIVHAKACLIDKEWLTLGSYNLDGLSKFGNLELNIEVKHLSFLKEVDALFLNYRNRCIQIIPEVYNKRGILTKFFEWTAFKFFQWFSILPLNLLRGKNSVKPKDY